MYINSLGISKKISETRVLVAMSGGVDSSVVAAMLANEGYQVLGVTLQLYNNNTEVSKKKSCCAGQDIYDAKRVAEFIGIRHYVFDYESKFNNSVIEPFINSYTKGNTPIPCVLCNQGVKFSNLLETAKQLGVDAMATGHYIRRISKNGLVGLYRAHDKSKDQSYFLFATTKKQLEFLRFPLGDLSKSEVRSLSAEYGLIVSDKPESQDICFVPGGDYTKIIKQKVSTNSGNIVDLSGNILGNHDGIINFTIGQRRGLYINSKDPLYVIKLNKEKSEVVVGPKDALKVSLIHLNNINWLCEKPDYFLDKKIQVKVRSTHSPVSAMIISNNKEYNILLDNPEIGVSPGQACVFYDEDKILGGGWISKAE